MLNAPVLSIIAMALLVFIAAPVPAQACGNDGACTIGDRRYHVRVPDTWDGSTPLPVLLHFHGWGRDGAQVLRNGRIATLDVAQDVLLLAPTGLNNSWSFRRAGSADVTFANAVIEDAAQHFPIDRSAVFVSGYSWGANMAWRYACDSGNGVAALLAVSGSLSQNEDCATEPAQVRQVYGLTDNVLDFPMGPDGDTGYVVALWRAALGCPADQVGMDEGPWNARSFLTFQRTSWDCARGRVVLDLHPGGHFIPHDWIALQIRDLLEHR